MCFNCAYYQFKVSFFAQTNLYLYYHTPEENLTAQSLRSPKIH